MSVTGQSVPGTTRTCPHCRAQILESAAICPACRHHLRAESAHTRRERKSATTFALDGTFRHPGAGGACEYSIVVSVRDDHGREVTRQVVGVGALHPDEVRTFSVELQIYSPS